CAAGIGLGLPLSAGNPGPLLVVGVVVVALAFVAGALVPAPQRRTVYAIVGLAFTLRLAAAALLYHVSVGMGRGGAIVGDDGAYADLAWSFVQWLRGVEITSSDGPPIWNGQAYLFGTFVYLESLVFLLFGRQVLALEFLNAGFAGATLLVLFSVVRRMFGRRPAFVALAVTAFFPSLLVWSALNLKDALVVLLSTVILWLLPRLQVRPRWTLLIVVFALMKPLDSMRQYIYIGLLLIVPASIVIGRRGNVSFPVRLRYGAAAAALSVTLVAASGFSGFITNPLWALDTIEHVRQSLAIGARTGYAGPPAIRVREGDTLYVPFEPGATPDPARPAGTPAIVFVSPDTRIVMETPFPASSAAALAPTATTTAANAPPPGTVVVRPGDIIVVGSSGTVPAPEGARSPLVFADRRDGSAAQLAPAEAQQQERGLVFDRTLAHIPRGLAYAVLAPFPWEVRRTADLATIPEMLAWYLLFTLAVWSLWRFRRHWWLLVPFALYVAGLLAVFTLAEGNVGTLYRHRSMIIPAVAVLASPGLVALWDALGRRPARGRARRG
ncbi:MAG: hypothetical protein EXR61_06125, partial [Chloroflexi bacterium]|nr:hypothetical protein [Chloroflexota bacterium]